VRREVDFVQAAGSRQWRDAHPCSARSCPTSCRSWWCRCR
jgi:hypothetical protein